MSGRSLVLSTVTVTRSSRSRAIRLTVGRSRGVGVPERGQVGGQGPDCLRVLVREARRGRALAAFEVAVELPLLLEGFVPEAFEFAGVEAILGLASAVLRAARSASNFVRSRRNGVPAIEGPIPLHFGEGGRARVVLSEHRFVVDDCAAIVFAEVSSDQWNFPSGRGLDSQSVIVGNLEVSIRGRVRDPSAKAAPFRHGRFIRSAGTWAGPSGVSPRRPR